MASPVAENSGYLTAGDRRLYATYHLGNTSRPAWRILFLPPFAEERKCAYRLMTETARALAAAGCDVLRFDYSATGESLGDHRHASMADWQADIAAAASALESMSRAPQAGAVGVRLGANFMLHRHDGLVQRLVCWEPLLSGQAYLAEMMRRKQLKEMYRQGEASTGGGLASAAWDAGAVVDFDGFEVNANLAAGIMALDLLGDLRLQETPDLPILILHVTGARRLSAGWQDVATACGVPQRDFRMVREKPFWGRLDYAEPGDLMHETVAFFRA